MAAVGSTDKVNVLVEFGRPQNHYSNACGAWSKTLRFRVEKDMEPLENAAIEDLGATNMGDGAALADFVTWARTNYPAKKTMLAIWDHGQGWRRRQLLNLRAEGSALRYIARNREAARARLGDAVGSLAPIPDDTPDPWRLPVRVTRRRHRRQAVQPRNPGRPGRAWRRPPRST